MTTPAHSNPTPPIDAHAVHQDAFLSHARAMANARDRLQASEKIWGAAAHAVIGFAKKRGWPIATHADIRDAARFIQRTLGDTREITRLFAVAEGYHVNFYHDTRTISDIREGMAEAEAFASLIADADERIPLDARPPHGKDFARYVKRREVSGA